MDQQAKIAQEANNKREQLREELVTVYVRLEKLPPEPLPVPKTPAEAAAPSGDGPSLPAQTPETLLALMAFAKSKAQEGDREAQIIYEQAALSQEMEQLLDRESRRRLAWKHRNWTDSYGRRIHAGRQRRAAKGRPCSWRAGCRRRGRRSPKAHPSSPKAGRGPAWLLQRDHSRTHH
eukprot:6217513-Amphidinium_carterae.1